MAEDFALRRRRIAALAQYHGSPAIQSEFRTAEDYIDFTERERAAGLTVPATTGGNATSPPASRPPKTEGAISAHLRHVRDMRAQGRR